MNSGSLENFKKEISQVREDFKHIQYVDTELTITEKTNIAISVDPHIKENQTFYIVKK